ncbi:MAG TPA: helix-turn-helix domain-containing protein [Solirubrobacter sp.]|nr:helix-turn-helix domain-containing protein [Solirubrobacter sp.]
MDDRTTRILEALDAVGVALLVQLIGQPATEAELVDALADASQSTVNRRLSRLRDAGLVSQDPGNLKAPGRAWKIVHPTETDTLISALLLLSDAVEAKDRSRRELAKRSLSKARATRLGIRVVGDDERSSGER